MKRSGVFSTLLASLGAVALLLLLHSIIRENVPAEWRQTWPWKLKLLDLQSATTAVIGTLGAYLARAQYARAVRPAIGYFGRVTDDVAPHGKLAWTCHLINGAQDLATVTAVSYVVRLSSAGAGAPADDEPRWMAYQETISAIESQDLTDREDFALDLIGAGRPVPAQGLMFIGWFSEKAMQRIETVYVKVRVIDRVGDTHERVLDLFKGVNRSPRHPDAPPF